MHLKAIPAPRLADTCGAGDWCTAGLIAKAAIGGHNRFRRAGARAARAALRYGQALAAWNCGFEGARGGMYAVSRLAFKNQIYESAQRSDRLHRRYSSQEYPHTGGDLSSLSTCSTQSTLNQDRAIRMSRSDYGYCQEHYSRKRLLDAERGRTRRTVPIAVCALHDCRVENAGDFLLQPCMVKSREMKIPVARYRELSTRIFLEFNDVAELFSGKALDCSNMKQIMKYRKYKNTFQTIHDTQIYDGTWNMAR